MSGAVNQYESEYAIECISMHTDYALNSAKPGIPAYPESSWQIWVCVASREAFGSLVLGERVAAGPSDGAAPAADIAEGAPRSRQVRIFLVRFVGEPAEGPWPGWLVPARAGPFTG